MSIARPRSPVRYRRSMAPRARVVGIVALAAETVAAAHWVEFAKWATVGYLVARGIAKRGNAYENR